MTTTCERPTLLTDPIIVRRNLDPVSAAELRREVRHGRRIAVLPGVFLPAAIADDPRWLAAAVAQWRPDAVICDDMAAHLSFWPELVPRIITVAVRTETTRNGFRFTNRAVPSDLVRTVDGIRITDPCLSTIELVPTLGTDVIDRALRSRQVSLDGLWQALRGTAYRRGNSERTRALLDSRGKPWSAAERLAHRKFRAAGLDGWISNYPLWCWGSKYFIDIAFVRQKLAIEIDGRLHEDDPDLFESDRWRQNALVSDGWAVLRFTWQMLVYRFDECLQTIKRMLRTLSR